MRILFLAAILFPAFSIAQQYTTLKTAGDKALSAYKQGVQEASNGEPAIAQGYFERALRAEPNFIDAKLALADTYVDTRDYFKAAQYFKEALALDSTYAPVAFYFLARIEWEINRYEDCSAHAASYLYSHPSNEKYKSHAAHLMASARFAAEAMKHPVPFNPKSLGPGVNTSDHEYFPSLTADGSTLVFTRQTRGDENFCQSTFKDSVWQTAVPLDDINTRENEGAQAISPDGGWLAFTACNRVGDGSQGSCDLYWSQFKTNGWSKPVPFSATINSAGWDAQPTIGADNKTIIFSRGDGGPNSPISLWQTVRQSDGKWTPPEKLPPQINVGGRVHTPFLHPDGQTLYFSSDSLPGMGGNDIFFVRKQADGSWGTPQNIGYPINTKGEEGMLVVSLDGKTGYFASDRPGGAGGLDIYSFDMPEYARPKPVTYARAHVIDAVTHYPIVAKVDFIDLKTGQSYVAVNTRPDGNALVCLPAGRDYGLNVTKRKYLFYSENFNLTGVASFNEPFQLNIELQPVMTDSTATAMPVAGKPIALRNVFFETGSASLLPESAAELDHLVALLTQMPELHIQINGHTDNVGNDQDNQVLSEQRAKAVHDYLISKGIDPARLRFKGFGESKPVETNDTPEGRAKNRRTEFEVWQ